MDVFRTSRVCVAEKTAEEERQAQPIASDSSQPHALSTTGRACNAQAKRTPGTDCTANLVSNCIHPRPQPGSGA
eukprot:833547-Pelagomonas_calceolata.AAC.3